MPVDPKKRITRIEIPLGGYMDMTRGLAEALGLQVTLQQFPLAPVLPRKRIESAAISKARGGKIALVKFMSGSVYSFRYSGTFRRVYGYLRELAEKLDGDDGVEWIRTQRGGSKASRYDSVVPET